MYNQVVEGKFIKRINRFIAEVEIDNKIQQVHVRNTGRCKELFVPGRKVFLETATNASRKTKFSLISIYKDDLFINIDSQIPNKVVYDALIAGKILSEHEISFAKREQSYNNSRFDIYAETKKGEKILIEVKGVTLENNTVAMFPDAPTSRGKKHINDLIIANSNGYKSYMIFLIQFSNPSVFIPNSKTDPEFSKILRLAHQSGVSILAFDSIVKSESIILKSSIPVKLN